jgi:hypothetical protein
MFVRCINGIRCESKNICKRFDYEGIINGKNLAAFFNEEEKCMNILTSEEKKTDR